MRIVAGVDSSTQSCKVELREIETGALLASGAAPHSPVYPPNSEQSPDEWWDAFVSAFSQAVATAAVDPSTIVGIAFSAQCHGLVILDEHGQSIRPAKLWNDTTCAPQVDSLRAKIGHVNWVARVGSLPTAAFTLGKLAWLAEEEPEAFARVRRVLLPHDYLTYRLTGRFVTDRSEASGTGYYDASENEYVPDFLVIATGRHDWEDALPKVLGPNESAGAVLPVVAALLGISPSAVVGPGGGDQHISALGLGARQGDLVFSFGTSGVVFTSSPTPVHDVSGIVDGVADATGGYLPLVSTLNAARVTDTFSRLLGCDHVELSRLALAAPTDVTGPILLPYLDGERKPDIPDATGSILGLVTTTSREEIARAAYEGVILGLILGAERLLASGIQLDGRVIAIGGGARSEAYPQLLADALGRPVELVEVDEAVARGACIQAAAIVTGEPVVDVRDRWAPRTKRVVQPRSVHRAPIDAYRNAARTVHGERSPW